MFVQLVTAICEGQADSRSREVLRQEGGGDALPRCTCPQFIGLFRAGCCSSVWNERLEDLKR